MPRLLPTQLGLAAANRVYEETPSCQAIIVRMLRWTLRRNPLFKAYLALVAVCFFWGTTYLGIRMSLESFPPLHLVSIRYILSGGLMVIYADARRRQQCARIRRDHHPQRHRGPDHHHLAVLDGGGGSAAARRRATACAD